MFGQTTTKFKKSKSKHSDGSGGSASKAATVNLISTDDQGNSLSTNKKSGGGTAAKSAHGNKQYGLGFFENFRRRVASFGRKDASRSQGVIDHIDEIDLLDLAADLGCISVDDKSFTFKPESHENEGKAK